MNKHLLLGFYNLFLFLGTTVVELVKLRPPFFWYKLFFEILIPKFAAFTSYDYILFFVLHPMALGFAADMFQFQFTFYMFHFETLPEIDFLRVEVPDADLEKDSDNVLSKDQKHEQFYTHRRNFRIATISLAVVCYIIHSVF